MNKIDFCCPVWVDLAQNGTQLCKGIHPVIFGFSVNLVSIYANRKSLWCFGNFSNPDKLPGEFHPVVVFGFYVT